MVVVGVAFKVEHGVDDVLDEFGAGEEAFFGDVADEADGGAGGLGEIDEFGAAIAELGDAAGGAGVVGTVDHLDGVDDAEGGLDAAEGSGDTFEVGFGEDLERGVLFAGDAEALGAELGLLGGFFGGDVEDALAVGGEMGEGLEEQCGFADAGLAAEEDGAAGDDAAAEDAVEFRDADGDAGDFERRDLVDGERSAGAFDVFTGLGGCAAGDGEGLGAVDVFGGLGDFVEAVPSLAVGAFAEPLGVHGATVAADVIGAVLFGHGGILAGRTTNETVPRRFATSRAGETPALRAQSEESPDDEGVEGDGEANDDAPPEHARGVHLVFAAEFGGVTRGARIVTAVERPLADGAGHEELGVERFDPEIGGERFEALAIIETDDAGLDAVVHSLRVFGGDVLAVLAHRAAQHRPAIGEYIACDTQHPRLSTGCRICPDGSHVTLTTACVLHARAADGPVGSQRIYDRLRSLRFAHGCDESYCSEPH